MGGNMSHIEDSDESPREHQSRIVACHSKEQWNTHFDAVQDSNKLMVIEFTATWCGPCRAMEPILREYADKFTDVEFVKLDVDEFPGEAMQFSVQEMPSFVFLKGVEVVDKLVGARKDELQKKIENHRNCDYNVCF
nr:thioredoxin H-type-like [Malus domestica]